MDLFEHDGEHGVRTGRSIVHLGGGCCAVTITQPHVAE